MNNIISCFSYILPLHYRLHPHAITCASETNACIKFPMLQFVKKTAIGQLRCVSVEARK